MADKVIYQLPSEGEFSVVELDDGRRYRKQLVKFGNWVSPSDPRKKMVLDKSWAAQVVQNFKDKVLNKVPVVEGHPTRPAVSSWLLPAAGALPIPVAISIG